MKDRDRYMEVIKVSLSVEEQKASFSHRFKLRVHSQYLIVLGCIEAINKIIN